MSTQPSVLSLFDPSTFVEGGGIINDVDVTWSGTKVALTGEKYNAAMPDGKPRVALFSNLVYTDREGKQAVAEQFWPIGTTDDFAPNATGTAAIALHGKAVHNGTNAAMLIKSLVDNGFPGDKAAAFAQDVRLLDGLFCHMFRKPETRDFADTGTDAGKGGKGKRRNEGPLVITKVHRWPWEAAPAQGATAAFKPNGVAAAAPAGGGAPDAVAQTRAMDLVQTIMAANPGQNRQMFNIAVFRGVTLLQGVTEPERLAVRTLAQDRVFQNSLGLTFPGE